MEFVCFYLFYVLNLPNAIFPKNIVLCVPCPAAALASLGTPELGF